MSPEIPKTQTSVQLVGPDELVLNENKEVPSPGPYQILAKAEAVGLCFSDLKLLKQFDSHVRKGPVVSGIEPQILSEIPSYVPRATATKALIEKAQNEKLLLTDLEGACITVSNLGAFGIESFIPIVIPGQCSILGVGRITDACVPDNDSFAVRKLMSLTLSVDHKVADGAYASQFLDFVRKLLEDTSTFE